MGVPDDAGAYESYQNDSETATLLRGSPPSSPSHGRRHGTASVRAAPGSAGGAGKEDVEDVRRVYRRALGTGYMLAMGVCGIVLVALGSTLDDLAENCGTTSIAVSWLPFSSGAPYQRASRVGSMLTIRIKERPN